VHVLIAGAGIAGLTTALSLHAAGIEAELVDSATTLKPLGVGINLPPHAVRELTEAEGPPFRSGSTVAITGSTSTVKFVAYPIAARGDGRALINWVAEVMIGGAGRPGGPTW
jgi:2-polyprenyl-6-methoxyphenol hydroxylase-like FAD-dependent oxidoreductase